MTTKTKKPLDAGFKRNIKILVGVLVIAVAGISAVAYMSSQKSKEITAAPSSLGKVLPAGEARVDDLTPAQKEKLERVQTSEAEAARRSGRSYIPETTLGRPENVAPAPQEETRPPVAAQTGSYAQYQRNQQRTTQGGNGGAGDGVMKQAQAIMQQLATPATVALVEIADRSKGQAQQGAGGAANGSAKQDKEPQVEIVGADEIMAARLLTPIDTYKTKFVLAEIAGGVLDGAQIRGEVVPMAASGDVEDVGIRFTSLRLDGKVYQIDAIALNEATATDAMDGSVDRRYFSRFVMPVMMAGLSGVSTYFTARGTPATKVNTGVGGESVIVDQERASREDAKNQGIGDAIDKGVQVGENVVQREANRPNRVTLDANFPIGVIFNAPVIAK